MTISSSNEAGAGEGDRRFAPPGSTVADVGTRAGSDTGVLFCASTAKLVLMSLCTFGLYEIYWFYKNWVVIKKRGEDRIMPFWRAFFAPIWAYSCFKHMLAIGESKSTWESGSASGPPIGLLAFAYFVLCALWRLPDPLWLVTEAAVLTLIPMNSYANAYNARQEGYLPNNRFSGWNWVGLTLGNILLVLSVIGAFLKVPH